MARGETVQHQRKSAFRALWEARNVCCHNRCTAARNGGNGTKTRASKGNIDSSKKWENERDVEQHGSREQML